MNYPSFFDQVVSIDMIDPLSNVLGTFENGALTFTYLDIVKAAGHSCPTVGGAYIMTYKALKALYKDEMPMRGMIEVSFKESLEEGVAGVIGNVVTHITGATDKSGFKGLNQRFARHSLMHFDAQISSSARFKRVDTGKEVDVFYNPSSIQPDAKMQPLMQMMMQGMANAEQIKEFGSLWQDRVKRIIVDNIDSVVKVQEI
ncbi:hypothetical protein [Sulfurimonas sp. HSL-1716]|uniref:hypothetical protein n=1 Tax=Hydrocurvibacter sulfurireducens TaxID=3131937 RepID=UPI0031F7E01A